MDNNNAKSLLLEHSEAKVTLYGTYLAIYLNILRRVSTIKKILVFDLMCGEGIYGNGGKGSPIIALETIKRHYFSNGHSCSNINIWFNDNGLSEIEDGVYKIDRVKQIASTMFIPPSVLVEYHKEDYDFIHERAVQEARNTQYAKSLFFIDPYGYKEISPEHIKDTLVGGNTEALLFLPISHMYRFASSAVKSPFPGSMPLAKFLNNLFKGSPPIFRSVYDFITKIKDKFHEYLSDMGVYVDTFVIERNNSNIYCLFFFTCNLRGFEKIVESKWKVDPIRGHGFVHNQNPSLFNPVDLAEYTKKLRAFIEAGEYRTNKEIYEFGLQNGFLPKHSHKIIKDWLITCDDFKVLSLDEKPLRRFSTYISDQERLVGFRFEKH